MPKVTVLNLHSKTIDCHLKTKKLLDILLSETDWMHSCGGKGRCTTCSAVIITGQENLSTLTDVELKYQKLCKITVNMSLAANVWLKEMLKLNTQTYQLPI